MKSSLPKVLFPIAGKPMVAHVLDAVCESEIERVVLVIGHSADRLRETLSNVHIKNKNLEFVEQREQLGTGHAVLQARDLLRGNADMILVLHADHPLIRPGTLKNLIDRHRESHSTITMLTVLSDDSMEFGRVLRDEKNAVVGIVEESDANPQQLAIRELNCGTYCFDAKWLWEHLPKVQPSGKKQEYYLTDLVGLAVKEKSRVDAVLASDPSEVIGINTRVHLARAEKIMRQRINEALMVSGVTIVDPDTAFVDAGVEIGLDTTIERTHTSAAKRAWL
jgi:bifunctional UDP-N-acetylglucosamine pyrophosphorylase/glucosamine-1-phosphate N-acetyltransferase